MKASERNEMYRRITEHGKQLLAIFPQATIQEPVALCKSLRVYEGKAEVLTTQFCNGCSEALQIIGHKKLEKIETAVKKLLGITEKEVMFINHDPRGYALKLTGKFAKDKSIYKDWGGYGIIAPDFTPIGEN